MTITKKEVLDILDQVKKYIQEAETKAEVKVIGLEIKNRWTGSIIFTSTKTTFKEAVEKAKNSGADLCDANLCNADLRGADLRGANLRNADLRGADLCDADLRGANLRNADLRGADLRNADLRGANLCDADLRNADLRGANLCDANLCDADLCNADLRGADLCDADLNCAKFWGKGGTKKLKESQVPVFLKALGFLIEK